MSLRVVLPVTAARITYRHGTGVAAHPLPAIGDQHYSFIDDYGQAYPVLGPLVWRGEVIVPETEAVCIFGPFVLDELTGPRPGSIGSLVVEPFPIVVIELDNIHRPILFRAIFDRVEYDFNDRYFRLRYKSIETAWQLPPQTEEALTVDALRQLVDAAANDGASEYVFNSEGGFRPSSN